MKIGTIEKNIQPINYRKTIGRARYPFLKMKTGDSFLVSLEGNEVSSKIQHRVASAFLWVHRKTKKRFISRTTKEGIRCWRVK